MPYYLYERAPQGLKIRADFKPQRRLTTMRAYCWGTGVCALKWNYFVHLAILKKLQVFAY